MAKRGEQHGGPHSAYRLKVVNRRYRRHILLISTPHYSFSDARGQVGSISTSSSTPSPPLYYPMKQAVPMMLVFLTLKYQGKADTIFQENGVALCCLIAATLAYWLIAGKIKENISCVWMQSTLWWAALGSALLSAISLVCFLLPYPSLSSNVLLPLVISSFVSVALLYPFYLFIGWAVKKTHGLLVWARQACTTHTNGASAA